MAHRKGGHGGRGNRDAVYLKERAGKKAVRPDADLFRWWCYRWGYVPVKEEIGTLLGVNPDTASAKIHYRGFYDTEKVIIAKEFELTAQEFVDLFYPGVFNQDGDVVLDRERRLGKYVKSERAFDTVPWRNV